jgi:outer membrane protein TolC
VAGPIFVDMSQGKLFRVVSAFSLAAGLAAQQGLLQAQVVPEDETRIRWSQSNAASRYRRPSGPEPVTVATKESAAEERYLSLNEALRRALENSEVIRVLAGVTATSSGRTIYDTAIAVTPIDIAKAKFDPVFQANSTQRRNETPFLDPLTPAIDGLTTAGNDYGVKVTDRNLLGGTAAIGADNRWDSRDIGGFSSRNQPVMSVSYTQPILAGAGRAANEAPIVAARLQQEQSYFQFKDAMQRLVRDVIAAYWLLVQARTELWAREIQVEQLEFSFRSLEAKADVGLRNRPAAAQAQASWSNARATLVQARANVLQREAALRNILGLPPEDGQRLVPSTPPTRDRIEFRWKEIVETAQSSRPDLIELNLILDADRQRLVQQSNLAKPSLDATAGYRWNGLSGRTLAGESVSAGPGDNTDWTMGVVFTVPLSLRESRARVRNQELLIAKDRANIQQMLHQVEHQLATSLRTIEQNLQQYEAYREARQASAFNVRAQRANIQAQRDTILSELLAITDWANAVAAEAQSLTAYNTELANLELQSGTILETHGVRFMEERFGSPGPRGWCMEENGSYPQSLKPGDNVPRYAEEQRPSEQAFDLKDFPRRGGAAESQVPAIPSGPDLPDPR